MRLLRYLLVIAAVVGAFVSAGKPSSADEGDDQTPPACGVESFGPAKLYPVDDGYRETVTMSYSVSDDFVGDIRVQMWIIIPDGSGTIVAKDTEILVSNPGTGTATWDGTYTESDAGPVGEIVPEGLYAFTLQVTDAAGNISNDCQRGVTVDHAQLVQTTFKKTVKPGGFSLLDKAVGRCSKFATGVRGWDGGRGYYSNTRCVDAAEPGDQVDPSVVITINGLVVPKAHKDEYDSLTVKLYGGSARSRPGSKAIMQYIKRQGDDPAALKEINGKLGSHSGKTVNANPFIRYDEFENPYVAWAFLTANGHRYDVKTFTVVLKYTALTDAVAPRAAAPRIAEHARLIAGL